MAPALKRRILLIDDQASIHEDYRKIICTAVQQNKELSQAEAELFGDAPVASDAPAGSDIDSEYDVDSAYNGEDAIALVEAALQEGRPYSVAFVDIRMPPGLDGVQTVRRMWAIDSELLVVLCSAYSDYSWEDIVRELGRTDRFLILKKPFDNIEVRQCAEALMAQWTVARTDPLTGLLNRRSFEEHLRRECARAVRHNQPLACVKIDIDFFQSINDRYGYAVGDESLNALAATIAALARPGDIVCHYGGEEFCALLPNADEATAAIWAERVRQSIADRPLNVGSHTVPLTASCGVAGRRDGRQEELVQRADHALRDAKASGRNCVVVWSDQNSTREGGQPTRRHSILFKDVTARSIMTTPVTCLPRKSSVADAASLLLSRQVSSAPVVNPDGTLAGIVASRDLMEALGFHDSWNAPVERFMMPRVIQYSPDTPAAVIFEFLCRVQIHRVVVVEEGKPVGLISRGTFLRWVQNYVRAKQASFAEKKVQPGLLESAEALTRRAQSLKEELLAVPDDVLTPVVSGVSSMQDILADLLTWARCSQPGPAMGTAAPPVSVSAGNCESAVTVST